MLIQKTPKKISSLFQSSATILSILFIISSLFQQVNPHIISDSDESISDINQMLIRRQPKHPRKRPTQQKNICEAECWAALSVIGILVLFCLTCIIHDYVVRKRRRKLDALRKAAELESGTISNLFSEKSNGREMSRDQQMRNIRAVMRQMKQSRKLEAKWPKKKRKQRLALRNYHLDPIVEEEEESVEYESIEGEKSETLIGDESVEDTASEGDPKTPDDQILPGFDKGKRKEITD
ncbi:683_t:CDS:1 [Cetraspora pellucida]|uniref:683_t:CDS:1 n=1 Tax=Cetraspora pellucida TaxID=1433469 RepID=A0ACA9K2I0_9GLOM|nr:683_t:CDS:1 [Cetraspora pellucida]